jgi:hypothetical protein
VLLKKRNILPKKSRNELLYIAPAIRGRLDENGNALILDEHNGNELAPENINERTLIYERQVKDWFLVFLKNFIMYKNKNKEFIVLMICLSYLRGVE